MALGTAMTTLYNYRHGGFLSFFFFSYIPWITALGGVSEIQGVESCSFHISGCQNERFGRRAHRSMVSLGLTCHPNSQKYPARPFSIQGGVELVTRYRDGVNMG